MKKLKMMTFKELVNENKLELMNNDKKMEEIEKRLDEKYARRAKLAEPAKM